MRRLVLVCNHLEKKPCDRKTFSLGDCIGLINIARSTLAHASG
jgi:hypothetical protein